MTEVQLLEIMSNKLVAWLSKKLHQQSEKKGEGERESEGEKETKQHMRIEGEMQGLHGSRRQGMKRRSPRGAGRC